MSAYQIGAVAVGGFLVAAYCTTDEKHNPTSTSKLCAIGAGVTAGLLFVYALFDKANATAVETNRLLEKSNNLAVVANDLAADGIQVARIIGGLSVGKRSSVGL
jgi:hypothetical protein